jgi:hypothetical protein
MVKPLYAEPEINSTEEKEMAKNTLGDLNDHLFERVEWLMDRDVKNEELSEEIRRTETVVKVSMQIVNIANLIYKAKMAVEDSGGTMKLPAMLQDKSK